MSEPGDKLERRYRDLARDEPPRSLDAAILAASRDAVRRRSSSRWAVPVSIAAVLVLAVGVTLRMQQEEPGIETSIPQGAPPPVAPAIPAQGPASTAPEPAQAPAPRAKTERKDDRQREQKPRLAAPPVEKPAATQSAPLAFPAQENAAPASAAPSVLAPAAPATPAPAAPPAPATAAQSAPAARTAPSADAMQAPAAGAAKRIAPMAVQPRTAEERAAAQPEDELERIARLRAEGRDAEADQALEQFRRRFPGYRIDPATWERVRPREAR